MTQSAGDNSYATMSAGNDYPRETTVAAPAPAIAQQTQSTTSATASSPVLFTGSAPVLRPSLLALLLVTIVVAYATV